MLNGFFQVEMKKTLNGNSKLFEEMMVSDKGKFIENYKSYCDCKFITALFRFLPDCRE